MDQIKIGKFIQKCRKNVNLTQVELAELLNISDRAVSKWETGNSMPDSSIMLELCSILKINVNELLTGEYIDEKKYMEKAEEKLVELKEINDEYERVLKNRSEIHRKKIIGALISSLVFSLLFISMIIIITYFQFNDDPMPVGLYIFSLMVFIIPLIGIIKGLIQRIIEIKGGEEDEAFKY